MSADEVRVPPQKCSRHVLKTRFPSVDPFSCPRFFSIFFKQRLLIAAQYLYNYKEIQQTVFLFCFSSTIQEYFLSLLTEKRIETWTLVLFVCVCDPQVVCLLFQRPKHQILVLGAARVVARGFAGCHSLLYLELRHVSSLLPSNLSDGIEPFGVLLLQKTSSSSSLGWISKCVCVCVFWRGMQG